MLLPRSPFRPPVRVALPLILALTTAVPGRSAADPIDIPGCGAPKRLAQCTAALPELHLGKDEAAQPVLGLAGTTPVLGDLLCDIALAGNRVHGYAGPGFFDHDHQLQITARDGIFRTYTLNPAPVGPDSEALVGVRVADPTRQQELGVEAWRQVLASLLPDNPASRDTRCSRLMNTPEAQLSASDRMAAVECLMSSMLAR